MTREEAKQIALNAINKEIELHGEYHIYMQAPQKGKNSWTLHEAKESILKDESLENTNTNLIDGIMKLDKHIKRIKK